MSTFTAVSKKESIERLLSEGKHSNAEIAEMTNTSPGYVAKVKSLRKSHGYEEKPSGSGTGGVEGEHQSGSAVRKDKPEIVPRSKKSQDPLSNEDRKTIYRAFQEGKQPPEVIAEHGFSSEAVDSEYQYFMRFSPFNVRKFQDSIMTRPDVKHSKDQRVKTLVKVHQQRPLTDGELLEVMGLVMAEKWKSGQVRGHKDAETEASEKVESMQKFMELSEERERELQRQNVSLRSEISLAYKQGYKEGLERGRGEGCTFSWELLRFVLKELHPNAPDDKLGRLADQYWDMFKDTLLHAEKQKIWQKLILQYPSCFDCGSMENHRIDNS